MNLDTIEIRKKYIIKDITLCDDCLLQFDECTVLSLMERGLVPGVEFEILSKKLGLYELMIDGTHILIREDSIKSFDIEVE